MPKPWTKTNLFPPYNPLANSKERKRLGSGRFNLSFNVRQVAWPVICKKIFQHQMSWERESAAEDSEKVIGMQSWQVATENYHRKTTIAKENYHRISMF